MNYADLFNQMHPGFFDRASIHALPVDDPFAEQVLWLNTFDPHALQIPYPERVTFGVYHGALDVLHDSVRQVDKDWVQYFNEGDTVFCAFDGEKIVSFCNLDDMGHHMGYHIGGPGCVGTIPAYRKQGIGLRMIQLATGIFQKEQYDISYIHYTHVDHWYAKLGYETVVRWNGEGIVWAKTDA